MALDVVSQVWAHLLAHVGLDLFLILSISLDYCLILFNLIPLHQFELVEFVSCRSSHDFIIFDSYLEDLRRELELVEQNVLLETMNGDVPVIGSGDDHEVVTPFEELHLTYSLVVSPELRVFEAFDEIVHFIDVNVSSVGAESNELLLWKSFCILYFI